MSSPHVSESKTVLDSGFHVMDSGFQVLDSSLCQWNLVSGFQSLVGFRIPLANFPRFWIPQAKISWILEAIDGRQEMMTASVRYRVTSKNRFN